LSSGDRTPRQRNPLLQFISRYKKEPTGQKEEGLAQPIEI